jgi:hypothetical protein
MPEVRILPQEESSNARFNGRLVMTRGFQSSFGSKAPLIAAKALSKIIAERVNSAEGADYLQPAVCNNIKFWVIDDGSVITCLLPEEY